MLATVWITVLYGMHTVCTHTNTHIPCTSAGTQVQICTFIPTPYIQKCTSRHAPTFTCAPIFVSRHEHNSRTYVCAHTPMSTCTHMLIHAHLHMQMHTCGSMHTHTHTQSIIHMYSLHTFLDYKCMDQVFIDVCTEPDTMGF